LGLTLFLLLSFFFYFSYIIYLYILYLIFFLFSCLAAFSSSSSFSIVVVIIIVMSLLALFVIAQSFSWVMLLSCSLRLTSNQIKRVVIMPTEKTTYLFSSSKQFKWNFSHLPAVNCCHIIITITLASRSRRYITCHLLQILHVHITVIPAGIRAKSFFFKRRYWHWMLVHFVALYF
jgi:hypothetical protein